MAIFGWICLAFITLLACLTWLGVVTFTIGASGKLNAETGFLSVVCAYLLYACYHTFPFVVTVAP